MKLIVGLGNPGKKYADTRHNAGFRVLDELVDEWQLMTKTASMISKQEGVLYAKPQTFMNMSGAAVLALVNFYKIAVEDILVIYDDKDMVTGKIKYRAKGSSGGQNGIRNIIDVLGTEEVARIKIGVAPIDPDQPMGDTANYVLGRFSKDQNELLPEVIKTAHQRITDWLS